MTVRIVEELQPYKVKLSNFYGPLDLLLYLAKENEVDVLQIPMSNVVEQYVEFLKQTQELRIDVAAEFFVVASHLMLLKTRTLLPAYGEEEEGEEEAEGISVELIRKLLEYRKFKEYARALSLNFDEMSRRFPRPGVRMQTDRAEQIEEALRAVDLWQIVKTFSRLLQSTSLKVSLNILYQDTPIEERIKAILDAVREKTKVLYSQIAGQGKAEAIGTLLALLELTRRQLVSIQQRDDGSDIEIATASPG